MKEGIKASSYITLETTVLDIDPPIGFELGNKSDTCWLHVPGDHYSLESMKIIKEVVDKGIGLLEATIKVLEKEGTDET